MAIESEQREFIEARVRELKRRLTDCEQRISFLEDGDLPEALASEKVMRKRLIAELDWEQSQLPNERPDTQEALGGPSAHDESAWPAVFLSHGHKDQEAAYAITEWISQLWPEVRLFISHKGLITREQIEQYSYLRAVSFTQALVCLLTQHSMTSNAVFDELDAALQLSKPVIQIMPPRVTADDRRVYSYLKELWEPKYGKVIYTDTSSGEQELMLALCGALKIEKPENWSAGLLMEISYKERAQPLPGDVQLSNVEKVMEGLGNREETIQWLAHVELEHDNQIRARGMSTVDLSEPLPVEARVIRLLLAVPAENLPDLIRQLRPLIDRRVTNYLQTFLNETTDCQTGARAQRLLMTLLSSM